VDGNAYWCQNDGMLLARAQPRDLLNYSRWEVVVDLKLTGAPAEGGPGRALEPEWAGDPWTPRASAGNGAAFTPAELAVPVFTFPLMVCAHTPISHRTVLLGLSTRSLTKLHLPAEVADG
jgi:hypothetical protein